MGTHFRSLPNQLTTIRLLCVPVLWLAAFKGASGQIGYGLALCLVTDLLDGMLARRLGLTSDFGSKLDSLADQCLQVSAIFWVLILEPEIFRDNPGPSVAALALYISSLLVGLVRFRRLANLHLYLSKAGGLFLYIFLIHAFLTPDYNPFLYIAAAGLFILSSIETLLLQLTTERVNTDHGSIFFRYLPADHPLRRWLSYLP